MSLQIQRQTVLYGIIFYFRPNYDRRGYPPPPMRGPDYDPMFDNAIYGEYSGPPPGRGYPQRGMPPPPPPGKPDSY